MEKETEVLTGPLLEQEQKLMDSLEKTAVHRLIYANREAILQFLQSEAGKALTEFYRNHEEVLSKDLLSNYRTNGVDFSDKLRGRLEEVKDFLLIPTLINNIQKRKLRLENARRQAPSSESY